MRSRLENPLKAAILIAGKYFCLTTSVCFFGLIFKSVCSLLACQKYLDWMYIIVIVEIIEDANSLGMLQFARTSKLHRSITSDLKLGLFASTHTYWIGC